LFEEINHCLHDWAPGVITEAECCGHRQGNLIRFEQRREIDPTGTVRDFLQEIRRNMERQGTLSHTGSSEQSDKSRLFQQGLHVIHFTRPANKARGPCRDVVALNWRDEAVTLSRDGLDTSRRTRVVAERLTDFGYARFEHRIADVDSRPNSPEQFVFGGQPPGSLGEVQQERQRLRGDRHDFRSPPEPTFDRIKAERAEG
jgi:hypothetical protein